MDIGGTDNDGMDTQNPASGIEPVEGNTEDLIDYSDESDYDYDMKEGVKTVTELERFVKSAMIQVRP